MRPTVATTESTGGPHLPAPATEPLGASTPSPVVTGAGAGVSVSHALRFRRSVHDVCHTSMFLDAPWNVFLPTWFRAKVHAEGTGRKVRDE